MQVEAFSQIDAIQTDKLHYTGRLTMPTIAYTPNSTTLTDTTADTRFPGRGILHRSRIWRI